MNSMNSEGGILPLRLLSHLRPRIRPQVHGERGRGLNCLQSEKTFVPIMFKNSASATVGEEEGEGEGAKLAPIRKE